MKKTLLSTVAIVCTILLLVIDADQRPAQSSSSGAPAGYCGDIAGGKKYCSVSGCHSGTTPSPLGSITSTVPVTGYIPGTTYSVTATITRANHTRFGFEVSPQNSAGTYMGTMSNTSTQTQIVSTKYITHTSSGITGSGGMKTWTFNWKAPAAASGNVTFYGAFNVTNANGSTSGDTIYYASLVVPEDITANTGIASLASDNGIAVFPNPVSDNLNIKFTLTDVAPVEIRLYDLQGACKEVLLSESNASGTLNRSFEVAGKYPAGIYFLMITKGSESFVQKIIIS